MLSFFFIAIAYLTGSLSTAVITARILGLPDPRSQGSGNPGATNVLRIGGKKAAAITLLGDFAKGLLPLLLGKAFGMDTTVLAAMGMAAFLGHLYPLFFGFKGGKGVATSLGVLLGLAWPVALAALATWLVVAWLFRYSSLSALAAAALTPLYAFWLTGSPVLVSLTLMLALLLFWRHRNNIRNLLNGTEDKIVGRNSRC